MLFLNNHLLSSFIYSYYSPFIFCFFYQINNNNNKNRLILQWQPVLSDDDDDDYEDLWIWYWYSLKGVLQYRARSNQKEQEIMSL